MQKLVLLWYNLWLYSDSELHRAVKERIMRKNIITYRIGLEEAVENGDVENIKYYSEQLRRSIMEYNSLRKRYYEVKGEIDGTQL